MFQLIEYTFMQTNKTLQNLTLEYSELSDLELEVIAGGKGGGGSDDRENRRQASGGASVIALPRRSPSQNPPPRQRSRPVS